MKIDQAFKACLILCAQYQENFPVLNLLQKKSLRKDVAAIYAFARTADNIADEGSLSQAERLKELSRYQHFLDNIDETQAISEDPVFIALWDVIRRHQLPVSLFSDLLSAFRQDILGSHFSEQAQIMDYCRRSAHPIGRLMLLLNGYRNGELFTHADAICSALQLINFYQDIAQDYQYRQRLYLASEDLLTLGIDNFQLTSEYSLQIAPLLRKQYLNVLNLLLLGRDLGTQLSGRLAWQVKLTLLNAFWLLRALSSQDNRDLFTRPKLTKRILFIHGLLIFSNKRYQHRLQRYRDEIQRRNTN